MLESVNNNNQSPYKHLLLLLATAYLFIAVTHIFFLPHYNVDNTTKPAAANSIFKCHISAKSQPETPRLHRVDKSTLDDKKSVIPAAAQLGTIVLFLISIFGAVQRIVKFEIPRNYQLANRQYSYLNFCTFRI